jgi:hypothetical protein
MRLIAGAVRLAGLYEDERVAGTAAKLYSRARA